MPTDSHNQRRSKFLPLFFLAAAMLLPFGTGVTAERRDMVFYFPSSHSTLPVMTLDHAEYLPLMRLMNLFTQIDRLQGKRKSLDIWFGNNLLEVRQNNKTVRLNNIKFNLVRPMRVENGEWEAPVDFLNSVLPTLVNQTIVFQPSGNRVFVGDVHPSTFTVRVDPMPGGAKLTVQFTHKIQLRTAARNGKWVFFLGSHPVQPLESNLSFQNAYISDLRFDDRDGLPKLILTPTSVGLDLYPSLSGDGSTLVAEVKKPEPGAAEAAAAPPVPQPPPSEASPSTTPVEGQPPVPSANSEPALPAVVLDAAGGGNNAGARGQNGLLEKNLNAQIVSRVRQALLATNKYRVVLTRIGDANPSFNDREATANIERPIAFISFNAGNMGAAIPRIMVYTYVPSAPPSQSGASGSLFVPWSQAQTPYASQSSQLAADLQQQLEATTHDASNPPVAVPVRILRSIAAPAVAIEVGSLAPDTNPAALTSSAFQQQIADGVVQALAEFYRGAS